MASERDELLLRIRKLEKDNLAIAEEMFAAQAALVAMHYRLLALEAQGIQASLHVACTTCGEKFERPQVGRWCQRCTRHGAVS